MLLFRSAILVFFYYGYRYFGAKSHFKTPIRPFKKVPEKSLISLNFLIQLLQKYPPHKQSLLIIKFANNAGFDKYLFLAKKAHLKKKQNGT